MGSTLDLVVVVVQAGDVGTSKLGNLTSRATDTAADIEDTHVLLDADLVGEVVLVAGNSLVEGLADGVAAEVEGLAPAVLVQVGCEVVVVSRQGGVLVSAGLEGTTVWSATDVSCVFVRLSQAC